LSSIVAAAGRKRPSRGFGPSPAPRAARFRARTSPPHITFLNAAEAGPEGGTAYAPGLVPSLCAAGHAVTLIPLPGHHPLPDAASRAAAHQPVGHTQRPYDRE
jgi:hypothetical protein